MTSLEQINYMGLKAVIKTPMDMVRWVRSYWGKSFKPFPFQVKRALATIFSEFEASDFIGIGPRDMDVVKKLMYYCHPKPKTESQAQMFRMIHTWNKVEDRVGQEACAVAKD